MKRFFHLCLVDQLFAFTAPAARADIFQRACVDPAYPSQGKQQSTTLAMVFDSCAAFLLGLALTASSSHVFASDVFSDDFSAPNGPLIGTTADLGGTWTQTGTSTLNPIMISGGAVTLVTTGQDAYAALSSSVANVAGLGLKTSLDLNVSAAQATGDYFLHLTNPVGTTSNFYERLFARSSANGYQLGLVDTSGTGSTTTWGTQVLFFGATYHVDVTWNFTSGTSNDTFSVAVDNAPYLTHTWTSIFTEPAQLSAVNFRQGTATFAPTISLDNLVVTTVVVAPAPFNIFKWEYVDPHNPSLGKLESTTLAVDGYGLHAQPGLDASSKNLTMAYLIGADLTGANFSVTNLTDADLSQANLSGAYLNSANLTNATLHQTNLTNVQAYYSTLTGADLSEANLTGAYLYSADLSGAN